MFYLYVYIKLHILSNVVDTAIAIKFEIIFQYIVLNFIFMLRQQCSFTNRYPSHEKLKEVYDFIT